MNPFLTTIEISLKNIIFVEKIKPSCVIHDD